MQHRAILGHLPGDCAVNCHKPGQQLAWSKILMLMLKNLHAQEMLSTPHIASAFEQCTQRKQAGAISFQV